MRIANNKVANLTGEDYGQFSVFKSPQAVNKLALGPDPAKLRAKSAAAPSLLPPQQPPSEDYGRTGKQEAHVQVPGTDPKLLAMRSLAR
jgi:hypothetical protein